MCAIMPIVIESVGDQGQRVEQGFEWPDDSATDRLLVRPGADGRASQSDQVIVLARLAGLAEHISLLIERDDRISAIWSGNGVHERAVDHGSTSSCSISPTCHYTRSRPPRAGPLLRAGRSPGRQQSTPFRSSADRVASPFENGER